MRRRQDRIGQSGPDTNGLGLRARTGLDTGLSAASALASSSVSGVVGSGTVLTVIQLETVMSATSMDSSLTATYNSSKLILLHAMLLCLNDFIYSSISLACSQAGAAGPAPLSKTLSDIKDSCWRFLRPHTIRGTALGSIALVARALIENPQLINWWLIFKAFYGLVALICGNGYIVGINQIYDIRIDKVNKPYLPIAAGDLSVQSAWLLVILFAAAGFSIVVSNFGPFITSLYCLGLFLGTIYSVPPFRLKRYPVAAFLIIATVRGFLLNFGVYYATRAALGLTFQWSSPVAFITCFVTLFALVIAITKDLPDVEGDRKYQISTLATKLGVRNIAFLGSGLLLANYIAAIVVAFLMPQAFRRTVMVPIHAALAVGLIFQTWVLEQAKYTKDAISQYYRFIWNLFYAEYIFFPLL